MNPLWGRKWKVTIGLADGTTALELSSGTTSEDGLRVVFDVVRGGYQAWWFGEVSIYNFNAETEQQVFEEGMTVKVEAGYQEGQYGTIFNGVVIQPLWERENVLDYKLTLNCIDADSAINQNFLSFTTEAFQSQYELVLQMAQNARTPIATGTISTDLKTAKLPRGKVIFGEPKKYFRQIASDNNGQWMMIDGKLNLGSVIDAEATGDALVISPSNGLIGTPQQTQEGVMFRVLMRPDIVVDYPPMLVKLDMSQIRQQKIQIGQLQTPLDQDGIYKVAGVRHTGDTRGNEWYTEVMGISGAAGKLAALMEANRAAAGGTVN